MTNIYSQKSFCKKNNLSYVTYYSNLDWLPARGAPALSKSLSRDRVRDGIFPGLCLKFCLVIHGLMLRQLASVTTSTKRCCVKVQLHFQAASRQQGRINTLERYWSSGEVTRANHPMMDSNDYDNHIKSKLKPRRDKHGSD